MDKRRKEIEDINEKNMKVVIPENPQGKSRLLWTRL